MKGIKRFYCNLKALISKNKYIDRYINDPRWRVRISLFGTVSINIMYVLIQLASGIVYSKAWFYALAVYYALLIVMRIFLIRSTSSEEVGKNKLKEFCRYRLCGIMLLIMNQALAIIVFYIVQQGMEFKNSYIPIIAMAAYTFAAMIVAIVNVVRYRRFNSPVMSAAKAISLSSAVVSLLSLEASMVEAFGEQTSIGFRRKINASTGAAVCIFVLTMAIYMIVRSSKEINKLKKL